MLKRSFEQMVCQINMGVKQRRPFIFCKISNNNIKFLKLLLNEGFISGFYISYKSKNTLCIFLKYINNSSIIKQIIINSAFIKSRMFVNLKSNYVTIVSTNLNGLMLVSSLKTNTNKIKMGGACIATILC